MLTDGRTDGRTDARTDGRTDGRKVITIAHPEQSSGELKNMTSIVSAVPLIWPDDLVSDSKRPSIELDLEIIKTNIFSNIHNDYLKNVTSGVLTRFSFDLAWWPSFFPQVWVPRLKLELETIKTNILRKIHDDCFKKVNVTSRVLTSSSFDLDRRRSFWPKVTHSGIWPRNHQGKYFVQDVWWLLQKCDH